MSENPGTPPLVSNELANVVPDAVPPIRTSVAKTGRVVVADEDYMNCGVSAEVLATIAERNPRILKAPAVRVANPEIPIPFSRPMENFALPDADKIVAAAKATLKS